MTPARDEFTPTYTRETWYEGVGRLSVSSRFKWTFFTNFAFKGTIFLLQLALRRQTTRCKISQLVVQHYSLQVSLQIFLVAQQVNHATWKTRNIETCNETMLRDKLRVCVSRISPSLDTLLHPRYFWVAPSRSAIKNNLKTILWINSRNYNYNFQACTFSQSSNFAQEPPCWCTPKGYQHDGQKNSVNIWNLLALAI